jgi:hypothetical protein
MSDISLSGRKGMQDAGRDRQKISALLWRAVRQVCDGGVNLMRGAAQRRAVSAMARRRRAGLTASVDIRTATSRCSTMVPDTTSR